jgi:hypothetical protein
MILALFDGIKQKKNKDDVNKIKFSINQPFEQEGGEKKGKLFHR